MEKMSSAKRPIYLLTPSVPNIETLHITDGWLPTSDVNVGICEGLCPFACRHMPWHMNTFICKNNSFPPTFVQQSTVVQMFVEKQASKVMKTDG